LQTSRDEAAGQAPAPGSGCAIDLGLRSTPVSIAILDGT
jgi:hypothetical protein